MKLLILEDTESDKLQIEKIITSMKFIPMCLGGYDFDNFVDYISDVDCARVVILDLDFGGSRGVGDGISAMNDMWKIDSTTIFVIFSKHVSNNKLLISEGNLSPSHIQISKEIDDKGLLTEDCLKSLKSAVLDALDGVIRYTRPPVLPTQEWVKILHDASISSSNDADEIDKEILESTIEGLTYCTQTIDKLCVHMQAISNSGKVAKYVGAVVFGSFGRGEARLSSDIEVSILYDCEEDTIKKRARDVAVVNWNRAYLSNRGGAHNFEEPRESMKKLIDVNNGEKVSVLNRERVDEEHIIPDDLYTQVDAELIEKGLKDGFAPIIDITSIKKNITNDNPDLNVLNKSFQLLVEYKPLYNPDLIISSQNQVLNIMFSSCLLGRDLGSAEVFRKMIVAFELSTVDTRRVNSLKQCKALAFRLINIYAVRASVIRLGWLDGWTKQKDNKFDLLRTSLSEPGIIKVAKCVNSAQNKRKTTIAESALRWLKAYMQVLERTRVQTSIQENQPEEIARYVRDLKRAISAAENFFKSVDLIFPECDWLSEHQNISILLKKL